jgi:HAE1 family hydrophobic/amphiphilic exporter-1
MEIHRLNQERRVRITGEVVDRPMAEVAEELRAGLRSLDLPPGFSLNIGGDYEEQQEAFGKLFWGLLLALVLVYIVMAALFEKFLDPLVIMFSVPFAAIGILLILLLINLKIREEGLSVRDAVVLGGRTRLRPILMTSLTTMLAMIPLAIGLGDGGEVQAPLARVVIGGLATSTLITLVLIPVLFSVVKEWQAAWSGQWVLSRLRLANGKIVRK